MTITWEAPKAAATARGPKEAGGGALPPANATSPADTVSPTNATSPTNTMSPTNAMSLTNTVPSANTVSLAKQAGIGLAALTGYLLVRDAAGNAGARAVANARAVEGVERSAGLLREDWLHMHAAPAVAAAGEWLYTYGHWPLVAAVLVWLARRHPAVYFRARDTMLLTAAAALVVFLVFPVAPPDLAGEFAALPSLHAGWDLVLGLSVAAAARRAWVRAAGAGLGALLAAAVVLAGHHYLVDVLAGAALAGAGWLYLRARRRPATLRGYAGWDGLNLHQNDQFPH